MSGEEALRVGPAVAEDRKLSAVKSWFTRSVSFGGVNGSSTALAAAAASKRLSEGNGSAAHTAVDSATGDQEPWGGFNITLKQLSMRRTKGAGSENNNHGLNGYERETALGSPSMTPRNVTPLVPLTPLRWKSSPPESSAGDELPHEKSSSSVPPERSRLGLTVTNSSTSNVDEEDPQQEDDDDPPRPTTPGFEGFRPTHDEEDASSSPVDSPSAQDPKTSTGGEDVMTMTIDFLRSRLLAERSASKVAKERIQELSKKVMDLELKLEQVVQEKNKAEKSAEEALLKLLTGDFAQVADCTARAAQGFNGSNAGSGGSEEIKEELVSVGGDFDFSRTVSSASSGSDKANADPWVTPKNMNMFSDQESEQKQEKRAAIESRLRSMWSQISSDMSVLAGDADETQEQMLKNWMDQVPAVLQLQKQDINLLSPPGVPGNHTIIQEEEDKAHVRARSDASIMLEEYEAHKRVQREWERNYHESLKQQQATVTTTTTRQHPPPDSYFDPEYDNSNFKQQQHSLESSHHHHHHHHRYNSNAQHHPADYRHRPAYDHPPHVEHHPQQPQLRAQESREWQQQYEDNYGNQQQGVRRQIGYPPERYGDGGAHLMWDSDIRSKARDADLYRHRSCRRRSRSADSSNWPSEEDMRRSMDHHQQYHNSAYPGKTAQNGSLRHSYEHDLGSRHPHGMYPDAKINGPGQYNNNGPAKAFTSSDPKLYLAYGPAYDAPREHDKSSVTDVLLALQKAKANIQKSNVTNQPRAGSEPVKERLERDRIRTSNSSPSLNYNSITPAAAAGNGHPSYVEQLNVGKGIDFFF